MELGGLRIQVHYDKQIQAKKLDESKKISTLSRLHLTSEWSDIAHVDLVVEAVFEDLAVKQGVFKQIELIVNPDALLASNTSYLDLDQIASVLKNPSRLLGLHFFSPANVMKLLEVVRARQTLNHALASGLAYAKKLGKLPVIANNSFGFVGNRIYAAYRKQCEFMLEEGAFPREIDKALEDFGFAMGPFQVADMSGLDIAWRMRQSQASQRNPAHRYVHIPDHLCEAGRLGKKTGAGYYTYSDNGTINYDDALVKNVIEQASLHKGITRRSFSAQEIQKRVLLAMFNEAVLLLNEQVVSEPSDCDVVLVNGYGFPRWRGGVIFWALQQDIQNIQKDLDWLADVSGAGFVRSNPEFLFESSN